MPSLTVGSTPDTVLRANLFQFVWSCSVWNAVVCHLHPALRCHHQCTQDWPAPGTELQTIRGGCCQSQCICILDQQGVQDHCISVEKLTIFSFILNKENNTFLMKLKFNLRTNLKTKQYLKKKRSLQVTKTPLIAKG